MTKNAQEFQDFLRDHVNLNPSRLERLESGVRGVKWLPQRPSARLPEN